MGLLSAEWQLEAMGRLAVEAVLGCGWLKGQRFDQHCHSCKETDLGDFGDTSVWLWGPVYVLQERGFRVPCVRGRVIEHLERSAVS